MTLDELRLHRMVQGILVRNYVNTQKLEVEVIGNSVYIEGELEIFEYHSSQRKKDQVERDLETARALWHIEKQIRMLPEVQHLEFKLRNWEKRGMQWTRRPVV
ncbi:MAG: hypothetical protein NZ483_07095 [Verrucomicrobiae bacterium]|nr:hypothetical protein [Verrucomicrobiae bacterium]MDW8343165.1 hypothetical protein [Verrucomicrobiae bacterium]